MAPGPLDKGRRGRLARFGVRGEDRFQYRVTGGTMNVHGIGTPGAVNSVYIPSARKTRSTLGIKTRTADGPFARGKGPPDVRPPALRPPFAAPAIRGRKATGYPAC